MPILAAMPVVHATWAWHPLHVIVIAWLIAVVAAWPRERIVGEVLLVSGFARLITWSPRIYMHFDKAYAHLVSARGGEHTDTRYGGTWSALMGLIWRAAGEPVDHVHTTAAVLSALTPAALAGALLWHGRSPTTARAAGLVLAIAPLPLAMAPTESHFVPVALLQVVAVMGAVGPTRRHGLLAALSIGLLAHLRPLQLLFAAVIVVVLSMRKRWEAVTLAAALIAWRLVEIVGWSAGRRNGVPSWDTLFHGPLPWFGEDARLLVLDPTLTPFMLTLLALWALWKRPDARLWGVLFLVATLPYMSQTRITDLVRFQLPAQTWWCALAVLGGASLSPRAQRAAGLALVASWWMASTPLEPHGTWVEEYTRLRQLAPTVHQGTVIRYSAAHDPGNAMFRWINQRSVAWWLPGHGSFEDGELHYIGTADLASDADALPWDRLTPVDVVTTPGVWRRIRPYPDASVPLGLYRVGEP
jgi:hypothetical protein